MDGRIMINAAGQLFATSGGGYVELLPNFKTYSILDHADLLKLKAAVEKALEVTPGPKRYWMDDRPDKTRTSVFHVIERNGKRDKTIARFRDIKIASEYVAWKNAQEGK